MIRRALRRITFDHVAIALIVIITAGLYYLATDALLHISGSADAGAAKAARAGAVARGAGGELHASIAPIDGGSVTSNRVADTFARIGYRLDDVRQDGRVPRVFLASLPTDLSDIAAADRRKSMFIETTLPLILHVNEVIARDRERIVSLRARLADGETISPTDQAWLRLEARAYGLDRVDMDELMVRVDVIPPSLALGQSAEESGWGTSRVAQAGNALFGQRIWSGDGDRFELVTFERLIDCVGSYARNLNSHPAYDAFRRARAAQRRDDDALLDGFALAGTLLRYSERGASYIRAVRTLIRSNALDTFDHAQLEDQLATARLGAPDA